MCLPVTVLSSMGSMGVEPPEIDKSLELSLKGIDDLDEYKKLTTEKMKNEAVIA